MCIQLIYNFLNSLFAASVAGGAIGGMFTYFGVRRTIDITHRENLIAENLEVEAFCKAIYAELESIQSRYLSSVGEQLGKQQIDQPFLFTYVATEEYFTVFNSNAHLIGKVNNDELRSLIVKTYTQAKGQLDSLRINSSMVAEAKELAPAGIFRRDDPGYIKYQNAIAQLAAYTPSLVKGHAELMKLIDATLRKLKEVSP